MVSWTKLRVSTEWLEVVVRLDIFLKVESIAFAIELEVGCDNK